MNPTNTYRPQDKPWRQLVRVESIVGNIVNVIVPGWSVSETIPLVIADLPYDVRISLKPDERYYAMVNIGSDEKEELVFNDWEVRN